MHVQQLSHQARESSEQWNQLLRDNLGGKSPDFKIIIDLTAEWTKRSETFVLVREQTLAERWPALHEALDRWYKRELQTFVDSASSKVHVCWLNESTATLFSVICNGAIPLGVVFWSDNFYLIPSMSLRSLEHQIESVAKQIIADITSGNMPKACASCLKTIGESGTVNIFHCQHCSAPFCLQCLMKSKRACPVCSEPEAIARILNLNDSSNEFAEGELDMLCKSLS